MTGLIDYIRLGSAAMYDRVIAEFSASKLGADYADMSDLALIADWVKRGVLAKHKVPWDARIPADIKHPDGYWYYISRSIYVIGINAAEVAEKDYPKSYADTLDPKWKGKVGTQTMDSGGSAATLHAFLRVKLGDDAWKRLAQNEPRIYPNSAPELTDLVRGRIPLAYIDAGSIVTQLQSGAPLKMVFPREGLAGYGVFGNVTSTAPHPNAARVWMNYLVSKRGSSEMSKSASYGTHPDATPPSIPGFKFPAPSEVWAIAPDRWETIRESWVEEWKKTVLKN